MSGNENMEGYRFSILSEDVATHDLFEDKTHERTGDNLYKLISTSPKGVTIGLEGSWGSGKSTVISFLKDKVSKNSNDKTLFFMFDAWAHDGDPLRRIFLESLIREIDPDEQDAVLKAIKEKITGRKRLVEVKAKKSTSRLGKFISLSALLIPFGSAFLGRVNYDLFSWPWSSQSHTPYYLFIMGFIFCLSPVWVILYWMCKGDKDPQTKRTSWEFFSVDSTEDYTQDITENGERTSIEFEDYFKCIIKTAMEKGLIDKCIIVIDNLDRVGKEHAKNIWSTLQTFFQKRSSGGSDNEWSDRLWFVIPFDRDGFIKIWDSESGDGDIGIAHSFLKKCFQLIAEVPSPVMSGWSQYAELCFAEALSQWPEKERKEVFSTYVRYASRLDKSPTPRDIKIFANQVGLLGAMWGGQMSVEAMCLYILFKEAETTNGLRKSLITGKLPGDYQVGANFSEVCSELAGLLFGVDKNKGMQLLLGPEINSAIKSGNGAKLSSLAKDHGNAFWIAYESTKSQWMLKEDHIDEYKISFTSAIHGLIDQKDRFATDIEKIVDIWISSYEKLDFSKFDYTESMRFVLSLCENSNEFIEKINELTTKKLSAVISLVGNEKFPESSLKNIRALIGFLESEGRPIQAMLYPKLDTTSWKIWLNHIENNSVSYEMVLPRKEAILGIANEAQFSSPTLSDSAVDVLIKTLEIYPGSAEWDSVADQIVGWMNMPNRAHECELAYSLALKISAKSKGKTSQKILDCLKRPAFWAVGRSSLNASNPSLPILAALSLVNELQGDGNVSEDVKSFWSNTADRKDLEEVFNQLKSMDRLDVLWSLCRDKKNSFAIEILRKIEDQQLYSCPDGVRYIDEYGWADDSEVRSVSENLIKNGAFEKSKNYMKDNAIIYQDVYKILYSLGNEGVSSFIESEIIKVNKDGWRECIESNGSLIYLVGDKNPNFSDALCDFIVDMVSGRLKKEVDSDLINAIPELLRKSADLDKSVLPKIVRAYFSSEVDAVSDGEFKVLSPLLAGHISVLDEKAVMERINSWFETDSISRVEWLVNTNVQAFTDPLESLIERIKLGLNSDNDAKNKIAIIINKKFNLYSPQDENETGEIEEEGSANSD